MSAPGPLRALQLAFARQVTQRGGADGASDAPFGGESRDVIAQIRSDLGIPAEERFFVYAHAWFARLHDVLREDHGALVAALGDDAFHDLAKLYFMARPPRSHSLRFAGEGLAEFLRGPVAEFFARRWPFAADLAALEWALVEVFDAPDDRLLERTTLAALAPEAWGALRLVPVSAHRLLRLEWPVDRLRAAWSSDRPLPTLEPDPTDLLVHRFQERVYFRPLSILEERIWTRLHAGDDFAGLCGGAAELLGDSEGATALLGLLERWIGEGLLADRDGSARTR